MSAATIHIRAESHQALRALAEETGQTMQEVLDKALDAYRRKLFFDRMDAGYAELRADAEAWAEHLTERQAWDPALMDGLDPDEHWTREGRSLPPAASKS